MEPLNTILLGAISAILSINLYVLTGLNSKIKDLKIDLSARLDKIDKDIDYVWDNLRKNDTRITVIETKIHKED